MEHLTTLRNTLTAEEYRVCELQYKEQPLARMTPEVVKGHSTGLLIKISIITGWSIPEQKEIKNVLYEQFGKKLVEDYGSLNVQEIEYAVRSYGTSIKDWGKSINLSLIDQAIEPYLLRRAEIRKLEVSAIKQPQLQEVHEPVDYEAMVEVVRKTYLKTKLTGLIPAPIYDILSERKDIDLDLEEKTKLRAQVESRLMNEATQQGIKAIREFRQLKERKKDYEILVRNECKKQAVANYFTLQNNIDNF